MATYTPHRSTPGETATGGRFQHVLSKGRRQVRRNFSDVDVAWNVPRCSFAPGVRPAHMFARDVNLDPSRIAEFVEELNKGLQHALSSTTIETALRLLNRRNKELQEKVQDIESRISVLEERVLRGFANVESSPQIVTDQSQAMSHVLQEATVISKELGWEGRWVSYPDEYTLEFRVSEENSLEVADQMWKLNRRLAERIPADVFRTIVIDMAVE